MRRREQIWFSNPRPRGKKWGILRRGGPNDPPHGRWFTFATEGAAISHKEASERALEKRYTIGELREDFLADLAERKKRDGKTIVAARNFLKALLPRDGEAATTIGPHCYERMIRDGYADATHQRALRTGRTFCAWLVKHGHLRKNPLTDVEPEGEAAEGKEHLSADEAAKWLPIAYRWAAEGRDASLALIGCLLLGLRPTEAATGSTVRDLDAGGMILRVTGKGRKKPRRTYRLDDPSFATYRALLLGAARGRPAEAPLLTGPHRPLIRQTLHAEMENLCKAAGVPVRCPHSLRTTHTLIRVEAGESVTTVSRTIGNTPEILGRHYKGGEAAQVIQLRPAVTGADQSGTSGDSPTEKTAEDSSQECLPSRKSGIR